VETTDIELSCCSVFLGRLRKISTAENTDAIAATPPRERPMIMVVFEESLSSLFWTGKGSTMSTLLSPVGEPVVGKPVVGEPVVGKPVVGEPVGEPVGNGVVGDGVGFLVGDDVGYLVGDGVGSLVGDNVGDSVGDNVGDSVGYTVVGNSVGFGVGSFVGNFVVGDFVGYFDPFTNVVMPPVPAFGDMSAAAQVEIPLPRKQRCLSEL